MRIRMNDERERRYERLEEATGESTRSGALDVAAAYYTHMAGGTAAYPDGKIRELMTQAHEKGSLTPGEIADILDAPQLPVEYNAEIEVGGDRD